jgi:hypothetical protein
MQFTLQRIEVRSSFLAQQNAEHCVLRVTLRDHVKAISSRNSESENGITFDVTLRYCFTTSWNFRLLSIAMAFT